ncbi:leucine-rich repeat domain-containing protein [Leptospira weilii]|nr:leucine-rich repeat domain-containing protein [Leptospira weilii]
MKFRLKLVSIQKIATIHLLFFLCFFCKEQTEKLDKGIYVDFKKALQNSTDAQVLILSSQELTVLPWEVGNLRNLQELSLAFNELSTIPEEIKRLQKLQSLDLYGN